MHQRHVATTGLENCKEPNDHLGGTLHEQSDRNIRSNSTLTQEMRELVRSHIQFLISENLLMKSQGILLRSLLNLVLKQFVNALIGIRYRTVVEFNYYLLIFLSAKCAMQISSPN